MTTCTYLNFPGNCEEAFKFYESVLGGKILMMLKPEEMANDPQCSPDFKGKILHARMTVGGNVLMASDAPAPHYQKPQGFHVQLGVDTPEEAERVYAALAEGGAKTMPMEETFWALRFGMCVDRFGTPWMVNCEKKG